MAHNIPLLALPCRYIIRENDWYHTCSLMLQPNTLCQALNPNLTTTTTKGKIPIIWELHGQNATPQLDPDHAEITESTHPEDEFDLDKQCPAGYSWEEVEARFDAFNQQLEEDQR